LFQMFGNQVTTTKVIDSQGNERELLVSFSSSDGAGADGANPLALTVWSKDSATGLYKGYSWQGTQSYATGTGAVFSVDASGTITSGAVQSGQVDFGSGVTANLQMDLSGLSFINSSSGTQASALDLTGVETASRALNALDVAKARLIELAAIRGLLGAAEKRLQGAAEINRVSAENFTAAESRIRDVDVAEESSVLIRQGILQQVGASVIAQANQAPRLALQLLQS
jgi:flagellin-like hook-associated protein FlgL